MQINIVQGHDPDSGHAFANVVIDTIRAFTVTHFAFLSGVRSIYLARSVEEALFFRKEHPDCLLAGEIQGLPIAGFDLDNSPARIDRIPLDGRRLVQKTTNGVMAALNALNAEYVLVTGLSNARSTANFLGRELRQRSPLAPVVQLIASHPSGDDDLACAQYIQGILNLSGSPDLPDTVRRIRESEAAQKFLDPGRPEFPMEDLTYCTAELNTSFVMRVRHREGLAWIERQSIS